MSTENIEKMTEKDKKAAIDAVERRHVHRAWRRGIYPRDGAHDRALGRSGVPRLLSGEPDRGRWRQYRVKREAHGDHRSVS